MSRRARLREPAILLGLLALSVLYTWPLAVSLWRRFAVDGDSSTSAWSLWWTEERLFSLELPWDAPDLFAPHGTMLAFSAHFPLAGAALSPVTALLGPAVTLNMTKLVLPALLAYAVYRLALEVGLSRGTGLAAGVLYGFSAETVFRVDNHFNFAAGALIAPCALLLIIRYRRTRRRRHAVLSGAVIGAGMLLDPTSVLFAVIVGATYVLGAAIVSRGSELRPLIIGTITAVAVAIVIASPQLLAMKRQHDAGGFISDTPTLAGSWVIYGRSLDALLAPSPSLPFAERVRSLGGDAYFGEGVSSYGWGLLLLGFAGLVLEWRRQLVRWLGLLWLAASLMALGATLRIAGSVFTPLPIERYGYELSSVLPYTWYVQIPGLADQRVAARFVLLGLLPAVLLAGFGIQALARRGMWSRGVLACTILIAVAELGGSMRLSGPVEQPQLYEPIRRDQSRSIVVDVPLAWITGTRFLGTPTNAESLLRETEHHHPIAYGVVGRASVELLEALAQNRFYTDLMVLQGGASLQAVPVPTRLDPRLGARNARALGVGWVVVQPTASPKVAAYLRSAGFRLHHQHDGVKVFRIVG